MRDPDSPARLEARKRRRTCRSGENKTTAFSRAGRAQKTASVRKRPRLRKQTCLAGNAGSHGRIFRTA